MMEKTISDGLVFIDLDLEGLSTRKTTRAYTKAKKANDVKVLKARAKTLRKCILMLAVVLGLIVGGIVCSFGSTLEKYKVELISRSSAQRELEIQVENLTNQYNNDIKELSEYAIAVTEENETITTEYNALLEEYKVLARRAELYDKYSYAIEGTDITIEQIDNLETLCKASTIGDVDFILSFALVESEGKSNAANSESTAKGYGQFLNSTSEFVYTDLLGYDNWTPEVAYDPDINFQMMVAYFDYLYEATGSIQGAINSYRGSYNAGYCAEIDKWLAKSGKSIATIEVY